MTFRSHCSYSVFISLICICGCVLSLSVVGQDAPPAPEAAAGMGTVAPEKLVPGEPAAEKGDDAAKNEEPGAEAADNAGEEGKGDAESQVAKVTVGDYTIHNSNPGKSSERKKSRHPQLWKFYMHGVADFFAAPYQWADLFGEKQNSEKWLDDKAVVKTPFKVSPLPSVRLTKGQSLFLEKPLIDGDMLEELRGSVVRIFLWIAGKDTGQGADLWGGAPGVDIVRIGLDGKPLQVNEAGMKTRGTFPWHCYYHDVWIPSDFSRPLLTVPTLAVAANETADGDEKKASDATKKKDEDKDAGGTKAAASEKKAPPAKNDAEPYRSKGLYVRLFNPASGIAWFSTISWEKLSDENTYEQHEKQDPITGSLAPNPYFDELPMHLCWGKAERFPWKFLAGQRGGAFGAPDITTIAGLVSYYSAYAKKDFHHLVLGVSQLADWYNFGKELDLLPPMDEGWVDALTKIILDDQDEVTGLWGYADGNQSAAVTAAYVEGLLGQTRITRDDVPPMVMPWRGLPVEKIPNAMKLVDTIIGMQSTHGKDNRDRGGWSLFAYDYKEKGELEPPITCSLASTANAMYLLRMCVPSVGRSYQNRIRESVSAATDYVFANCVTPEGLWRQSEVDEAVTTAAHMPRIIEASYLLEERIVITLKASAVDIAPVKKGTFVFVWKDPDPKAVSLRLYAVPKGTASDDITTANLVGIIHQTGTTLEQTDPLLIVRIMKRAAKEFWNLSWDGDLYAFTTVQLGMLDAKLPMTKDAEPLTVKLKGAEEIDIYSCTVNARGERSRLVVQPFEIAESGDPDEEEEEPADVEKEGVEGDDKEPKDEKPKEEEGAAEGVKEEAAEDTGGAAW